MRREGRPRPRPSQTIQAVALSDLDMRTFRLRGPTVVATLTMALGIAATTAVFSVANGVLLRPLPYADPAGLVMVWDHWNGSPATWLSEPEYLDYRDRARSFATVGALVSDSRNLTGGDAPVRVRVGVASAGVFAALGARPERGRLYSTEEDVAGGPRVALISDGLWRRRFNADPATVGRPISLDDSATTVIGIMPEGFQLPLDFGASPMDVWLPLALGPVNIARRGGHYLNVIARLRPGVTPAAAEREVRRLGAQMVTDYPGQYPPQFGASTRGIESQVVGDIRPTLVLLLAAVGCVLLIACANVANLLLSRAHARQREIVVRTALGASPGRIVRQLLGEGVLLSLQSGALGLVLAVAAVHGLAAAAPATIPRIAGVGIDGTVVLFALALSFATGIGCALVPALQATRVDLNLALKGAGRAMTSDRAGGRLRRALIAGEVALSVLLLIGAGLVLKSFWRLHDVDPGFSARQVLTARISLPVSRYADAGAVRAFYRRVADEVRALPAVSSAGLVRSLPMTDVMGDWGFDVEGRPRRALTGQSAYAADWQVVSPGYFRTMGIGLREGHEFAETDDERASGVVIVSEALARLVWPNGDAVGQRVIMGGTPDSTWRTVIAVVADVRHRGLDAEARPEIYLPISQWPAATSTPAREMYLVVRSPRDPRALAGDLRRAVQSLDLGLPLSSVRTMDDVLSGWTAARRLTLIVLGALAGVALGLAAGGLYGVVGYVVSQRTSEIGVRRALGADARSVIILVARQGGAPVVIGLVAGLVAAVAVSRLMASMLFEVSAVDPGIFVAVPIVLAGIAGAATYVPMRRALRVDPLVALRAE